MVKLEHIYIRLWSKHGLVFLSSLGGIVSIGTAETGCALARTFELLLIIGMVKKKKDFAAFDQGWRFMKW